MSRESGIQGAIAQLKSSCGFPVRAAVVFGVGSPEESQATAGYLKHRKLEACLSVRIAAPVRIEQFLLQFGIEIIRDERVREKFAITRKFGTTAQMVGFDSPEIFAYIRSPHSVAGTVIAIMLILAKSGLHCAIPAWKAETIKPAGVKVFETIAQIAELSQSAHRMLGMETVASRKNSFKPYSGRTPFGWKRNGDVLEVDFDQLKVVQEMKRLQFSGRNCSEIAFHLNLKGIATATGQGKWSRQTVKAILNRYESDYSSLVAQIQTLSTRLPEQCGGQAGNA